MKKATKQIHLEEEISPAKRNHVKDSSVSDRPAFSLEKALGSNANEITPDTFLQIGKDEMKKAFGHEPEIEKDSIIPEKGESEADFEWRVRRNLILMQRYLIDQISRQADPERVRADLITIDRFLNTCLSRWELDAEDAEGLNNEYFEGDLMRMDPVPPFAPQFGALERFYEWMRDELSLQDRFTVEGIRVPVACRNILMNLQDDIPYLMRLYEIATDPANDDGPLPDWMKSSKKPSRKSTSAEKSDLSQGEIRVMRWRESQRRKNHAIASQFRRDLKKSAGWSSEDIASAVGIAELFLINILPMLLLRADQSQYHLRTFMRQYRRSLMEDRNPEDYEAFINGFSALLVTLTDLKLIPPETDAKPLDPFYSELIDMPSEGLESLAPSWPLTQAPNPYEENLDWFQWNLDRNQRFLLAFAMDMAVSGLGPERVLDNLLNVQTVMAELFRYEKCTMETLPEGLDRLLRKHLDYCDFMSDPQALRRSVGSLRRFYRSMIKQGYLAPEIGDELLAYLKQQTRVWAEHL